MTAASDSSFAALVPTSARNPSSTGSPEAPMAAEPCGSDGLSHSTSNADTNNVLIPRMMPLGMSRRGSTDSSEASGNSSIARKNQTANGSDASTPFQPNGSNGPLPSGSAPPSAPMFSAQRLK